MRYPGGSELSSFGEVGLPVLRKSEGGNRTACLCNALRSCLDGEGVHPIEVPIDYVENENVFYDELDHKTQLQ